LKNLADTSDAELLFEHVAACFPPKDSWYAQNSRSTHAQFHSDAVILMHTFMNLITVAFSKGGVNLMKEALSKGVKGGV
jgi:hypothetical protein